MDYNRIYYELINRAKNRVCDKDEYYELHHIVPRCLGGLDEKVNLVSLTPEEHYVAHQLLVKIYPDNNKLVYAATMMIPNRPSNKLYGWLRRKLSEAKSVEQHGIGNTQYNTRWICNIQLKQNKKIKSDELMPEGWVNGRNLWHKLEQQKNSKENKEFKRQNLVKLHEEYYEIYKQVGFDKFVELTGYKYSKQNLVQQFSKLVKSFKPQNGKKR